MDVLHAMPGHLIRRAHQVSAALFAEECAGLGLTAVQYAALVAIRENPGVDATRLSRLVAFDRSTLGGVLERLEAKGWVRRAPGPADKRVKLLRLALDGERLLRRAEPAVQRAQRRLLEPLSPADRAAVLRLLGRLAAVHGDAAPVPARAADGG